MTLSDRERATVRLLIAGHTYKTAARELDLSPHTVKGYSRVAMAKYGVNTRAQLVAAAVREEASNRRMDRGAA